MAPWQKAWMRSEIFRTWFIHRVNSSNVSRLPATAQAIHLSQERAKF
jgi:hypothetical protein